MTAQQAVSAIYQGNLVDCSKDEYHAGGVRKALQEHAGKMIDHGDVLRAQMALQEVKRLDSIHGHGLFESGGAGS